MKTKLHLITRSLLVAATFIFDGHLSAKEEHPNMHPASEAIRKAQTSVNPIQDLEHARKSLELAKANKGGNRSDAIELVDTAIAALKAGNKIEANRCMTEAISSIEKGVAMHPHDKKRH